MPSSRSGGGRGERGDGVAAVGGEDREVPAEGFPRRGGGDPGDGLFGFGGDPGEFGWADEGFRAGHDGVGVGVGGLPEQQRGFGGFRVVRWWRTGWTRPGRSSRRTSR